MSDIDPNLYKQVICTACEHINDIELNKFLDKRTRKQLTIVQSNDYYGIQGHTNCKNSLKEFEDSLNLNIIESMELQTTNYRRFMIIGF
jgi:hypothetical protein